MERSVLFLTVPAAEGVDLLNIRDYVLESLAAGVLILGRAAPAHSPPQPQQDDRGVGRPAFTGAGAKEKRLIYGALADYQERHGLGCFGAVAAQVDGLTVELLREAMRGAKLPMEIWRKIDKALDTEAGKAEGIYGET